MGHFTGSNQLFVPTNKLVLFSQESSGVVSVRVITGHKGLLACRRVASVPDVKPLCSVMLWRAGQCEACQAPQRNSGRQQRVNFPTLLPFADPSGGRSKA
jgi:hypothetical protein